MNVDTVILFVERATATIAALVQGYRSGKVTAAELDAACDRFAADYKTAIAANDAEADAAPAGSRR